MSLSRLGIVDGTCPSLSDRSQQMSVQVCRDSKVLNDLGSILASIKRSKPLGLQNRLRRIHVGVSHMIQILRAVLLRTRIRQPLGAPSCGGSLSLLVSIIWLWSQVSGLEQESGLRSLALIIYSPLVAVYNK